jgi:hypothetical protein
MTGVGTDALFAFFSKSAPDQNVYDDEPIKLQGDTFSALDALLASPNCS